MSDHNTTTDPKLNTAPQNRMLEDLAKSGLDEQDAIDAGLEALDGAQVHSMTDGQASQKAMLIPYRNFDKTPKNFYRLKPYRDFGLESKRKYIQPKDTSVELYIPPIIDWEEVLKNTSIEVIITEGEKKALKACKEGYPTVAIGGIFNFGSKKAKIELLEDLKKLAIGRRPLLISFDRNITTNPDIKYAMETLAELLTEEGAGVGILHLQHEEKLDDYLVAHSREEFEQLPRTSWNIQKHLTAIRYHKKLPREIQRHERIARVILDDMLVNGKFYKTEDPLYYFDEQEKRLYDITTCKARGTRAYLNGRYNMNASNSEWRYVTEHLAAYCVRHGEAKVIHIFSHWSGECLYLKADHSHVYKIDEEGYSQVDNGTDGVLFHGIAESFIKPAETVPTENPIRMLFATANHSSEVDLELACIIGEIWFYTMLFPEANKTRCIVLFFGPQGSCKTSALRAFLIVMLGPDEQVSSFNKEKIDDIWASIDKRPLVGLDNIDGKHEGLENILAIAATGGTRRKRRLYTDNEEVIIPIRAFLGATSRKPISFTRPDVVDRLLVFPCDRRTDFRPEEEMQELFNAVRPEFWAWVLDKTPAIIKALKQHQPQAVKYRMADFANFALAIGGAVGLTEKKVVEALEYQDAFRKTFQLEQGNIPAILEAYYDYKSEYKRKGWLTAAELYGELTIPFYGMPFPFRSARSLAAAVREEEDVLASQFPIAVKKDTHSKSWKYLLIEK